MPSDASSGRPSPVVTAHGWQQRAAPPHVVGVLGDSGQQDGVRADLDKCVMTTVQQPPQCRREAHRRAQVLHPVVGVGQAVGQQVAGHRGVDGYRRCGRPQSGEPCAQTGSQRVHLRAVGGHIDVDPPAEPVALLQHRHQLRQNRSIPGQHRRSVAVAGGDRDLALPAGDELLCFGEAELRRHHRSAATHRPEHPGSSADHPCGVFEAQRTGDVRRRNFTHAVPHHCAGLDPP